MLNCLNTPTAPNLTGNFADISSIDRKRRFRFKWVHEPELCGGDNQSSFFTLPNQATEFPNFVAGKDESEVEGLKLRWPEAEKFPEAINNGSVFGTCIPDCATPIDSGKPASRKRKAPNPKAVADDDETIEASDDNSKKSEVVHQKSDYIHVRARRGQATDSHSLAERVRRERISERMKYLQDLVPGCNRITGKAGMLDEIINYVQSLQKQVELLSMKLAAVNPGLDFDINNFFTKEAISTTAANFDYDPMQQPVNSEFQPQLGFQPIIAQPFVDTSCFTIQATPTWDAELQNLYNEDPRARSWPFLPQTFPGCVQAGNLKMEM